jgi:tetrahydromethanopterin:alpha-L-glutamate ligase
MPAASTSTSSTPPSAEPARLRIALFIEGADWHASRLLSAMRGAGAEVVRTSLARCRFSTEHPFGIAVPGFGDGLPDGVFVRTIAAGSFEAVTLRLGLLHALVAEGVPVWNSPRAIEACVDKAQTTWRLARAGLPTPTTWALESRDEAAALVTAEAAAGRRLVLKPLFGSQGKELRLVADPADLSEPEAVAGVYYLQRYVGAETGWHDHRVFVSAGRAIAAMTRRGASWITNIRQGAAAEAWRPGAAGEELAVAAAAAVGASYAGVDLIRDPDGNLQVLEVNSMPAWNGLQGVADADLTQALIQDFLAAVIRARAPAPRAVAT